MTTITVITEIIKHLPGIHDQKRHGGRQSFIFAHTVNGDANIADVRVGSPGPLRFAKKSDFDETFEEKDWLPQTVGSISISDASDKIESLTGVNPLSRIREFYYSDKPGERYPYGDKDIDEGPEGYLAQQALKVADRFSISDLKKLVEESYDATDFPDCVAASLDDPKTCFMFLSSYNEKSAGYALLHELAHAAVYDTIEKNPDLLKGIKNSATENLWSDDPHEVAADFIASYAVDPEYTTRRYPDAAKVIKRIRSVQKAIRTPSSRYILFVYGKPPIYSN